MKIIFAFIEKLYNTIRGNGLFIAIAIFFPFVIYQLQAGREIIYFLKNENQGLNLSLIIFSFFLLSVSLWCIPAWSIKLFEFITGIDINDVEIYNKISKNYYGYSTYQAIDGAENLERKQFSVRYIALIPWFLFMMTFIAVLYDYQAMYGIVFLILSAGSILVLDWLMKKNIKKIENAVEKLLKFFGTKSRLTVFIFAFLLLYFCTPLIIHRAFETQPYWYVVYFYLGMLQMYVFFYVNDYYSGVDQDSVPVDQQVSTSENSSFGDNPSLQELAFFHDNDYCFKQNQVSTPDNRQLFTPEDDYKSAKYIHGSALVVSCIMLVIFSFLNFHYKLGNINPIVICIVLSALMILSIEFVFTSQILISKLHNKNHFGLKIFKFILLGAAFFITFSFFFKSLNQNLIRLEKIEQYNQSNYEQQDIGDYFDQWWENNGFKEKDTVNVFLISGQGGGSRAGAWFLHNMLKMDSIVRSPYQCKINSLEEEIYPLKKKIDSLNKKVDSLNKNKYSIDKSASITPDEEKIIGLINKYNKDLGKSLRKKDSLENRFYRQIFSISTVSGSSSGAQMYMAFHQIKNDSINYKNINSFNKDIYTKNFLSSGLFGLLMSDFTVDAFLNWLKDERRDKNYVFQQEEKNAFTDSYLSNFAQNVRDDKEREEIKKSINQFFDSDFMSIYQDKTKVTPLVFLNCTVTDDGTKGVFAPVNIDSFSFARNLYRDYRVCHAADGKALPFVTCVNQSQAFPIMNSYNYLHGSGRLGDGGFYENSGTETTLGIYKFLTEHIKNKEKYKNVKIICISLINSLIEDRKNAIYQQPSYLNTLVSLANNPFYGHQSVAVKNLRFAASKDYYEFIPSNSYTLTRMLSTNTFEALTKDNTKSNTTNFISFGRLWGNYCEKTRDDKNSTEVSTKTPPKEALATIYIQYSGSDGGLKNTLENKNYDVPEAQKMNFSIDKNNIRYFHEKDLPKVDTLQRILKENNFGDFEIKYLGNDYINVPEKQIEVWMK